MVRVVRADLTGPPPSKRIIVSQTTSAHQDLWIAFLQVHLIRTVFVLSLIEEQISSFWWEWRQCYNDRASNDYFN